MAVARDELRSSRWAKVPRTTTEDQGLTDGEYRLLVFLIDHGDAQGWSRYPVDKMAVCLQVSVSTVHRRLRQLEAKGCIRRTARYNSWGVQLPNGITVLSRVSSVTPSPKRLKRVSAGKPRVSLLTPEEEHRTTRSIRPSSSVLVSSRQQRSSRNGQQFKKLDLDEFKKKRKTKKAQDASRLGGRSRPSANGEELSIKEKVQQHGMFYDILGEDQDRWEEPLPERDAVDEELNDIAAAMGL